jgi:hypothetical protein
MAVAGTVAWFAGCIISDQLTTLTIHPDGSADWVRFQSNIRSTQPGPQGVEELQRFIETFDSHQDPDYVRITDSGGEVQEARWVRHEEPYANLLVARLPNASALENFGTVKNEQGEVVAQARFLQDGNRRRFSLTLPVPDKQETAEEIQAAREQRRREQANGISETRVAVAGGRITASQGFIVAGDKRSALVDADEIQKLLWAADRGLVLFLEWELD